MKSKDVSYPAESPAILGCKPLSDITEIIGEGTGKKLGEGSLLPKNFYLNSTPPPQCGGERIREEKKK